MPTATVPVTATTPAMLGRAFRHLREQQDWTLDIMVERLRQQGVNYSDRSGVSRLEERGTHQHAVVLAYQTIFDKTYSDVSSLARQLEQEIGAAGK